MYKIQNKKNEMELKYNITGKLNSNSLAVELTTLSLSHKSKAEL